MNADKLQIPQLLAAIALICGSVGATQAAEQSAPVAPAMTASDPAPATEMAVMPDAANTAPPAAETAEVPPVDYPKTAAETIALARAFLGGDEALENIKSIHFRGSILMQDGTSGDVDIIVQKPLRQHVTITIGTAKEETALDGYEGWRRVQRSGQRSGWELTLLTADQVRHLRANAFENIAFFKGIESVRGSVEFLGEAEKDGVKCVKLAFAHPGDVSFVRYFNRETGQLVVTETDSGGTIRESGVLQVRGVRFPKELVNAAPNSSSTVIFSSITLNEEFPASLFEVPMALPGP